MTHVFEMGSGVMIYVPSFSNSNVDRGISDTQTTWLSHKLTLIFSK
jgi:hypothetical protein